MQKNSHRGQILSEEFISYDQTRKLLVSVDVDGVLRDWDGSVYDVLKDIVPLRVPEERPEVFSWNTAQYYPDIPDEEFYDLVFSKHAREVYLEKARAFPGSIAFIKELNELSWTVVVVNTHQPNLPCILYTLEWLSKRGVKWDHFLVSPGNSKHILESRDHILVDDKPDNLEPRKDILFGRPYNEHMDNRGCPRATTYEEVLDLLWDTAKAKGIRKRR